MNRAYPKVVIARTENLSTIADGIGHETRTEITGEIDGVTMMFLR